MDLHRPSAQNQRLIGLRFLQMLLGLSKQQEKRMISRWFRVFRVFRFWKPYHFGIMVFLLVLQLDKTK